MADNALRVRIRDGAEQWTYQGIVGRATCPNLSRQAPGGDFDAQVAVAFTPNGRHSLPSADADFWLEDDEGTLWTGFLSGIDAPDVGICAGLHTLSALGMAATMGERKHDAPTVFGPQWQTSQVLARTPEDAIAYSVGQRAGYVSVGTLMTSGVLLQQTEDFQGRTPQDVVAGMSGYLQYLSTPPMWMVTNGIFSWLPMDLAPHYEVYLADGARVRPKYEPTKAYNVVTVAYGDGHQTVTWPEAIVYDKRKRPVELYINAGVEVKEAGTALQLAQGLYARVQTLSLEWSAEITIPGRTAIREVGGAPRIKPWRFPAGVVIRIPDLNAGAWGAHLSIPTQWYVTRMCWQGQQNLLTLSAGDPRGASPQKLMQMEMAKGQSSLVQPINLGNSAPYWNPGRSPSLGPQLELHLGTDTPPPVDYAGSIARSTKYETVLPENLPPLPPAVPFQINNAATTGKKGVVRVPPQKILQYSVFASKAASGVPTVTVKITRASNGALVQQIQTNDAVLNAAGLWAKVNQANVPNVTVEKPDHLVYEVTVADEAMTDENDWVNIGFDAVRYFPDYPGDPAPVTGKTTTV